MSEKTKNLFVNAILLTITAMILRVIGIVFKVYISNEVGLEGMGLYKLIGTVTMVALTFATSGISFAVTRLVSEEVSKRNYSNVKNIIFKAAIISGVLGSIAAITMLIFSDEIALYIFKDSRVLLPLRIIAISIPFISVTSSIKGYFYAVRDVFIPITTQFSEKFIQISVVLLLLSPALSRSLEYGLAVLALSTAISEIFSFFYTYIVYVLEKRENKSFKAINTVSSGLTKAMFKIALPIAGSSYAMAIFKSIEMTLIPLCLIHFGMSKTEAISVIGGVLGMVFPIIMFPASLLMSLSTILMPEISRAKAINNNERVNSLISRSIGFTSIIGIITAFVFFIFPEELSLAIYNRTDIGLYFKMISLAIPFMYLDMIMSGILHGLNQQLKSLEYDVLESLLRLLSIYLLLPIKGVPGLILTIFITSVFSFTLSFFRIIKVTRVKVDFSNWFIKPLALAAMASLIGLKLWSVLIQNKLMLGINIAIIISIIFIIYFSTLKLFKGIKIKD